MIDSHSAADHIPPTRLVLVRPPRSILHDVQQRGGELCVPRVADKALGPATIGATKVEYAHCDDDST